MADRAGRSFPPRLIQIQGKGDLLEAQEAALECCECLGFGLKDTQDMVEAVSRVVDGLFPVSSRLALRVSALFQDGQRCFELEALASSLDGDAASVDILGLMDDFAWTEGPDGSRRLVAHRCREDR